MASKHGNFLNDPFSFDAGYFNISPREAKSMDPQQRLLLHAAVEALDDAGYSPGASPSFQQDSFGVYVGVATGDYVDNLRRDIDVYYSPGRPITFDVGDALSDTAPRNLASIPQRAHLVCLWLQRPLHGRRHGVLVIHGLDLPCLQGSAVRGLHGCFGRGC